jgi:predicted nucleic acid-binding protein
MNYVLDTNVISELVAREPNQKVIDWIDSLDPETVYVSVITIGELRKGIEKLAPSRRKDDLTHWLNSDFLLRFAGKIIDITGTTMLVWGELTGRLERDGKPVPAIDSLIAASVLERNFTLATRNDGDFQHAGIAVVNPWELT